MSPASSRTISKSTVQQPVGSQRRNSLRARGTANRAQINVQAEFFSKPEQAAFGAFVKRKGVPLRTADRAEQNRVRRAASGECFGGQRFAGAVDRSAAEWQLAEFELVAERASRNRRAFVRPRASLRDRCRLRQAPRSSCALHVMARSLPASADSCRTAVVRLDSGSGRVWPRRTW